MCAGRISRCCYPWRTGVCCIGGHTTSPLPCCRCSRCTDTGTCLSQQTLSSWPWLACPDAPSCVFSCFTKRVNWLILSVSSSYTCARRGQQCSALCLAVSGRSNSRSPRQHAQTHTHTRPQSPHVQQIHTYRSPAHTGARNPVRNAHTRLYEDIHTNPVHPVTPHKPSNGHTTKSPEERGPDPNPIRSLPYHLPGPGHHHHNRRGLDSC